MEEQKQDKWKLSPTAGYYIAGLLTGIGFMAALYAAYIWF